MNMFLKLLISLKLKDIQNLQAIKSYSFHSVMNRYQSLLKVMVIISRTLVTIVIIAKGPVAIELLILCTITL